MQIGAHTMHAQMCNLYVNLSVCCVCQVPSLMGSAHLSRPISFSFGTVSAY